MSNITLSGCLNSTEQAFTFAKLSTNYASYFSIGVFTTGLTYFFQKGDFLGVKACHGFNMISIATALNLSCKEQDVRIQVLALSSGIIITCLGLAQRH